MHQTIRRFAAAASLTMILAATPAIAAPSRDDREPRDRSSIVRIVDRIIKKMFGLVPNIDVVPPWPFNTNP